MPSPAASVATSTWRGLAEFALGENARAGRVPVANLHAAVNLRHGESPFAQFAEWPTVFAVATEEIERVLVFGEDEQLHLRVFEDTVLLDEFPQPDEFCFDLLFFERLAS